MNLNNRVLLIGIVTGMPVMRNYGQNGIVMRFKLKTTDKYYDRGKEYLDVQYHNIIVWDELANKLVSQIMDGSEISLEGRLKTSRYNDKNGNLKYIIEIIAISILVKNPSLFNSENLRSA